MSCGGQNERSQARGSGLLPLAGTSILFHALFFMHYVLYRCNFAGRSVSGLLKKPEGSRKLPYDLVSGNVPLVTIERCKTARLAKFLFRKPSGLGRCWSSLLMAQLG